MKRGLSTGKPTKREAERIEACKNGLCVACHAGNSPSVVVGCDYHHLKSGNLRRGHRYGIALCGWHHRKIPWDGWSTTMMRDRYGPSLMDGSRLFHETYGSDDELLAIQDRLIGWTDE